MRLGRVGMGFGRVPLGGRMIALFTLFGGITMGLGGVFVMLGRGMMRAGCHLQFLLKGSRLLRAYVQPRAGLPQRLQETP